MKAIVRTKPGKEFSSMKVEEVESQNLNNGEIKVKMASSRINPVDMDLMKGFPSIKFKDLQFGGIDGAGTVTRISNDSIRFSEGQSVFFYRMFSDIGTWAEEITIPQEYCALVPSNIKDVEAGAIALPLLTAYEGIISLNPSKGETILIHGAGGGVGFQAVHIAKALGLKVIANASERDKQDLNKAGVDKFIDYKKADFYNELVDQAPDYVFDVVGKETLKKSILLKPKAIVSTTFPEVSEMHKTGVNLPGVLKFIMKLMNRKYSKLAVKNRVKLLGQVTGANGTNLQKAATLIEGHPTYFVREQRTIDLEEIESNGLSKSSIGKVINFSHLK